MKSILRVTLAFFAIQTVALVDAAVPPAEKLLPDDTLAVLCVPNWDKARAAYDTFSLVQLWKDQAMKPFADKFRDRLKDEVITPLERELGLKVADYADIPHGQVTLALIQNGWSGQTNQLPAVLFMLDAGDKEDLLKKTLTDVKKRWVDNGKKIKTEKVRDVEFTMLMLSDEELEKAVGNAFPGFKGKDKDADAENGKKEPGKSEIWIGQSGSLLIGGNNLKAIEKVLAGLSGGVVSSLGELPAYQANHSAMFRDAALYGWVHYKAFNDIIKKIADAHSEGDGAAGGLMPKPGKIMEALGLNGVRTIAFNLTQSGEGTLFNAFVGAPESGRRGLFKVLVPESRESSPPSFVPAEVVKFVRWRLDLQKAWASLEAMVADLSPQLSGLVKMGLDAAGKDKDPNFDIKRQLIGNLGNDVITLQKAPRSAKSSDLNNPPSLFLLGSPNAEQLVNALLIGTSLLSPLPPVNREFLGRKIYSIKLQPGQDPETGKPAERSFHFCASGGYVAMASDPVMIEEYLRSSGNAGKPLTEASGLNAAAQRVGGMSTGWFGYENQTESLRTAFESWRKDPAAFERYFTLTPDALGGGASPLAGKPLKDWFDVTLLPSFDRIVKYLYFTVYGGSATADGISFKTFAPLPPQLRK